MDFVHLHNHSHYSLLDGLTQIPDLMKATKEKGMKAIALTDHGAMYGAIEFYEAAQKNGIKPIIGIEAYLAPYKLTDKRPRIDDKYWHLILLAQNLEGYRNLMKLVTISNLEGFYYKPRIDKEVLKRHSAGLIGLSGCLKGEINGSLQAGNPDRAKDLVREYQNIFGNENFFLEIQNHPKLEQQILVNKGLKQLGTDLKVPLVATNDVHYLHAQDNEAQDILVCVSTGKTVKDADRLDMRNIDVSLKSPDEMAAMFPDDLEAVANTVTVADKCNLEIPLKKLHFPKYGLPANVGADEHLRENSYRGLAVKYKLTELQEVDLIKKELDSKNPGVSERLEYELGIISKKGYSEYFLVVADFVNWSRSQGIITTTRGSAAGSITSYSIGILNINPLDYKLPFERFLNPYRPSPPDIDLDIADNRRHEVLEYVVKKYGREKVAQIVTFGTMMARAAARDVGRALGMPYEQPDRIAKMIPLGSQGFPMYINRAKIENPDLAKAYLQEPETHKLLDLAEKVEGCCRHSSVHAAGVVIAPDDLTLYTPLQLDTEGGGLVTQYDMNACESVGLVKMDFLGIRNLSILGEAIRYVEKIHGVKVDLDKLPLDDKKTFEMLARGETFGVFQLNGSGMTKYLVELKPEKIFDIMAMIALYRPGPIDSIPDYIKRKHNPKLIRVPDPRLKPILEMSYGVITFQDDVLLTAINIAGYTWEEADKLRKAMGKKIPEEMAKQKEKFISGCIEKGKCKPELAQKLFELIEPFAAYGFNKAHAASYAQVSYQTAYMKANYPVEYMAALMSAESGDMEKIGEAIRECQRMGIEVLPPDINESFSLFGVVKDTGKIRFGLAAIKNVGEGVVEAIIGERKERGPFKSLEDFLRRIRDKNLNKKMLESMSKAGALDRFGDRAALLENIDALLSFGRSAAKAASAGQNSLFGALTASTGAAAENSGLGIKLVAKTPMKLSDRLAWEKELLGLYITEHPFARTAPRIKNFAWPINRLAECPKDTLIFTGGIVANVKKVMTKKGEAMAFVQLEDERGQVECVVFPKVFFGNSQIWQKDYPLLVKGKIEVEEGVPKMLVNTAMLLTEQTIETMNANFAQAQGSQPNPQAVKIEPGNSVTIKLPANLDERITTDLKKLLSEYPGDKKLFIKIANNAAQTVETGFKVNFSLDLKNKIEQLTGLNSVDLV